MGLLRVFSAGVQVTCDSAHVLCICGQWIPRGRVHWHVPPRQRATPWGLYQRIRRMFIAAAVEQRRAHGSR